MIDSEKFTTQAPKFEIKEGGLGNRENTQRLMAAMLMSILVNPDSFGLIQNAHKPKETGFTNRERWQDIFSDFQSRRSHIRTESDFSHFYDDGENEALGRETPLPEAQHEPLKMPFEFYPHSVSPTDLDKAGALRANQIMREQLAAQGWEGGSVTEDQLKKANRDALRQLHTDTNESLSDVDLEAAKLISGQMSEIKKELFTQEHDSSGPAA